MAFGCAGGTVRTGPSSFGIATTRAASSLLLEWEGADALEAFLADPDVRESMRLGGVVGPPQLTLLDAVEELPF